MCISRRCERGTCGMGRRDGLFWIVCGFMAAVAMSRGLAVPFSRCAAAELPPSHRWPLIFCANKTDTGTLRVENVVRDEYSNGDAPTIGIDPEATVRRLIVRDCGQRNHTRDRVNFFCAKGKIGELVLDEPYFEADDGAGENVRRDDSWPLR